MEGLLHKMGILYFPNLKRGVLPFEGLAQAEGPSVSAPATAGDSDPRRATL